MMNVVVKMMNFVLTMMSFVLKMMKTPSGAGSDVQRGGQGRRWLGAFYKYINEESSIE